MSYPILINFETEVDRDSLLAKLEEVADDAEGAFSFRKLTDEEAKKLDA